jgi:hypothetical protein
LTWHLSEPHSYCVRQSDRLTFVNAYRLPAAVRQRFAFLHESLRADQMDQVEAAARQWYRLVARHPRARLAMPSTVVAQLVDEFTVHAGEYTAFCRSAFGKSPPAVAGDDALWPTFRFAQADDGSVAPALPLIFRVDRELNVPSGRYYLASCGGGRTVCHELPGVICLQHLRGVRRSKLPYDTRPTGDDHGPSGFGEGIY